MPADTLSLAGRVAIVTGLAGKTGSEPESSKHCQQRRRGGRRTPLMTVTPDVLAGEFAVNVYGPTYMTQSVVGPGAIGTDLVMEMNESLGGGGDVTASFVAVQRGADRPDVPEDIADAVLLIASEKSRWITAQFISVSAGANGTM